MSTTQQSGDLVTGPQGLKDRLLFMDFAFLAEMSFCLNEIQSQFSNVPLFNCRYFMPKFPTLKRHPGRQAVSYIKV